jgi:hypothetical protein
MGYEELQGPVTKMPRFMEMQASVELVPADRSEVNPPIRDYQYRLQLIIFLLALVFFFPSNAAYLSHVCLWVWTSSMSEADSNRQIFQLDRSSFLLKIRLRQRGIRHIAAIGKFWK